MATVDLIARLTAQGEAQFVGALGSADSAISGLGRTAVNSAQSLGRLFTGGIVAGATAFGVALGAGALEGLRFNNSMEQVSAQLMAFLKDGDKVEATLAMIQERAANTPFAFEDMAKAVTGLIPAATQASIPIEELIGLAEILAASNPAEGLEGAAFALREAVSGDFTSIIERFNLPRAYINQLREEGVPALEAVQMAMAQLGLDTDLVTNLAQTFEGRWSTVKDTFVGLAAQLTKPIFDVLSTSMGGFLETLNQAKPQIDAFVTGITGAIGGFIANLQEGMTPLNAFIEAIWNIAPRSVLDALVNLRDNIIPAIGEAFSTYIQPIIDFVTENVKLGDVLTAVGIVIAAVVIPAIASMIAAAAPLILTFAAIVAGVTLVRTAWEENWGGIQEKTAEVGAYLAELFNGTIIPALLVFSAWFTENQETIVTALTAIAAGLATFSILSTVAGWVTALIAAWGALSAGITAAGGIITAIVAVLGGPVTLVIAAVAAAVALLGYAWSQNWGGIQEKTATAIEFVKTTIAAGLAAIQLFWDTHGATIIATATAIWEGIVAAVTTYVEMLKANIATAVATVQTIWSGLQALWEVTSSVFSQIYAIFKDSLALILGVISTALFAITGDMDSAGKAWTEVVEVAGARIKEGWTAVWNTIKNFTTQVMVAVQGVVSNAMVSLGAAIMSGLTAIKTAVSNGWNAVKNLTMTAIVNITNTVKNTDWAAVGLAIAMGIVNGISSGVAMVTEAAANLAQSALDAAKALLGIQSPSRMFYEIGENVAQGFINALGDNEGNVSAAVDSMLTITSSLSSIGSTISGIYQKNELDPLKAALDGIGQSIGGIDAKGLADSLGITLDQFRSLGVDELNAMGGMGAFGSQSAEAQRYIDLLKERARLQDELYDKSQAMLELEKQQQDLALLKAQQDLLNLIRDNNLSASILDGLELGLDADLGAIMAAMSAAMQEMLAAAQTELGIASPSKEFYRIGQQVTAGLANALWAGEGMISGAMTDLVTVPSMANMSAATMPTFTNSTTDPTGGFAAQTINITVKIEGGTTDQRTAAQRGVDEALQAAGINADIRRRM